MQVTIDLEQDLWLAAREKARSQKTSVDSVVSQLLRLGLAADTDPQRTDRFTFALPGGVVTTGDVSATLEDS